jgi:micrococcal nuclease
VATTKSKLENQEQKSMLMLYSLISILCLSDDPKEIRGKVVAITDGDTISVLDESTTKPVKIRLDGIDAPERAQPFGTKSREALGNAVFQKQVVVKIKGRDRYKRLIGVVMLGDENINLKQVREGWAWHYIKYAKNNEELKEAQEEAKARKKGLWADDGVPVPPWEWRAGKLQNDSTF